MNELSNECKNERNITKTYAHKTKRKNKAKTLKE